MPSTVVCRPHSDRAELRNTLGQILKDEGFSFHHIVTSPETKARETANAISVGLGGNALVDLNPDLAEHARETMGFLPRDEFEAAIARFFRDDLTKFVLGEETADATLERFAAVIQEERFRLFI